MPKIRELIPTDNLYGDQFEPWLDMDLSQFQGAYSQAMQGDPAGRGSAIGIGNLLGLGTDANNQFVVPENYQQQWDAGGNWTPTNAIDQMSMQYQQGNKMGANTTSPVPPPQGAGGVLPASQVQTRISASNAPTATGTATVRPTGGVNTGFSGSGGAPPAATYQPTTEPYNPNPNLGSQGGLMPPSMANDGDSMAGGGQPAGMSDSDWLSQQYQQGNKMPTNVTGNQSQFAGMEGTTPNNGVNVGTGGPINPQLGMVDSSQGGNQTIQNNWGSPASVPSPPSSGINAATSWTSPTATPNPNSNPNQGQYGPAQGVAGSGAATTPYNPSGPATPVPGGGNGNPYTGTSGGTYTGPTGPQGGGVLSGPNPGSGGGGGVTGPGSVFPTGTNQPGSGVTQTNQPVDPNDPFAELFGLGGLASVPNIDLGTMPTMSGGWAPGFEEAYNQNTQNMQNAVKNIYGGMQLPNAQAAQIDTGQLSELKPQQVQQSQALQQLLSGQGYSTDVMKRLNAGSTDAINKQAIANRGSARLQAEQSGLGGSPVQQAMESQIARQRGDSATRALNENAIQNANVGMENFRQGANMDFSREQNNMQQANAMALAKASQMLTAMSQNAGNQQQSNMANFGAGVNKEMTSAGAQAGIAGGQGAKFGDASINKQTDADKMNAGNAFNWAINQAGLNQNTNNTNANLKNSQWTTGVNGLLGLGSGNGGANYSAQANNLAGQQQPSNLLGSTLQNAGQGMAGA